MAVVAQICLTIAVVKYGIANHLLVLVAAGTTANAIYWNWVVSALALISIGIGKLAAVVLIITIQGNTRPKAKFFLYALAAVNVSKELRWLMGMAD